MQTLLGFTVGRYALDHDIGEETVKSYRSSAMRFERWIANNLVDLAEVAKLGDAPDLGKRIAAIKSEVPIDVALNATVLNAFLSAISPGRSKHTLASYRREILVLWRDAFEIGLVDEAPRRVREIRAPETPKEVWTVEEVAKLIEACSTLRGRFKNTRINKALYFESIIRFGWDSSLRLGDCLTISVNEMSDKFDRRQNKTGRLVDIEIDRGTIDAIEATFDEWTPSRDLVWPLWGRRKQFYYYMRKIVAAAGLRGTFKYLRRSSVTNVESQEGGTGWIQAGHSNPNTTARWYLNRSLAYEDRPRPERLPRRRKSG